MSFARLRLACALSLILILTLSTASVGAATGDVGTPAPDFNLQIFEGAGSMTLSEHAGKVVVMSVIGYA